MIQASLLALAMMLLPLFTASAAAAATPSPDNIVCPAGVAQKGEKPLLVVTVNEGMTLFVCGHKEAQGKIKIHLSDFEIFSQKSSGQTKSITREKSRDFRIWDENKKLFVQEVTWFSGGWTQVFQWNVSCDETNCTRSSETCAFDKDVAIKHQAQRELRDTSWGEQKRKTPEPSLLDSIKDSAMTGSVRAQDFFLKPDPSRHFTKEGEKIYHQTQALLKRLVAAKCL